MGAHTTPAVDELEYGIWSGMKQRCLNSRCEAYGWYGGRGITVCRRWRDSYVAFRMDMGPRPTGLSIDRIDNDGGYWCGKCEECAMNDRPANCRWADAKTQRENARPNPNLIRLQHDGHALTVTSVARSLGLSRGAIYQRIRVGWTVEQIVSRPAPRAAQALKGVAWLPRLLEYRGQLYTAKALSRKCGVSYSTLRKRLSLGIPIEEAVAPVLTTDVRAANAERALRECRGNKTAAAKWAGIDRRTIYRWLRRERESA